MLGLGNGLRGYFWPLCCLLYQLAHALSFRLVGLCDLTASARLHVPRPPLMLLLTFLLTRETVLYDLVISVTWSRFRWWVQSQNKIDCAHRG